nr:hypothetical protein [Nocardia sp. CC201C]
MMYWYDHGPSGWGYVGMGIGMLLFWGLVIATFALIVRMTARPDREGKPPVTQTPAEQLLAERFARGDIDEQEYISRLTALRTHTATRT